MGGGRALSNQPFHPRQEAGTGQCVSNAVDSGGQCTLFPPLARKGFRVNDTAHCNRIHPVKGWLLDTPGWIITSCHLICRGCGVAQPLEPNLWNWIGRIDYSRFGRFDLLAWRNNFYFLFLSFFLFLEKNQIIHFRRDKS